jgi:predicted acylesterase/phospholipase RssA/CRP-like cAMP-binding protein
VPEQLSDAVQPAARRVPRDQVREVLARDPMFSSLSADALADLASACELRDVPGGSYLVRAGQPLDMLYGVVHGALRIVHRDNGVERTMAELYRGELLGVLGLVAARPSPADVFVIRDSTLLAFSRGRLIHIMRSNPAVFETFVRLLGARSLGMLDALVGLARPSARRHAGNIAVMPLSRDASIREITDRFVALTSRTLPTVHVTAPMLERELGPGAASDGDERVAAWLSDLEGGAEVLLYECDVQLPAWTARCRRQSDRLVIVAPSAVDARLEAMAASVTGTERDGLTRPIDLVLVHDATTKLPSGTRAWWSRIEGVRRIHHVRHRHAGDIESAVRRIVGRPVGLVLSGGGAHGIAHVGVLAAIAEAGIPIDYVCGTSMGAIFAAGVGQRRSSQAMRAQVRELFAAPFALYDVTVPISSLLAGKKLDRVLQRELGEADIEDLWLPFFCVSTDLSRAELVVHDRGSLCKSVRASCAIPGIFPPLLWDGRTLVDGGLMNNLPVDLLLERCPGPIIAVDVLPYGDPTLARPSGAIARRLRALRTRIKGEPATPPLFDILMRSTMVGSKYRQQTAAQSSDQVVYLEPPVASFGMLQWRAHDALFEVGLYHAREQLARHRALFPRMSGGL